MTCLSRSIQGLQEALVALQSDEATVREIELASAIGVGVLAGGGKILIAGNGGSAAESVHFAAELVGRFKSERVALPALALTADIAALTAIANDYGYEHVFERQVLGLGAEGDLLVLLSTSGNSKNLVHAALAARSKHMKVIALLGKDGGALKGVVDIAVVVPSGDTAHIQELHLMIIHAICAHIEHAYVRTP